MPVFVHIQHKHKVNDRSAMKRILKKLYMYFKTLCSQTGQFEHTVWYSLLINGIVLSRLRLSTTSHNHFIYQQSGYNYLSIKQTISLSFEGLLIQTHNTQIYFSSYSINSRLNHCYQILCATPRHNKRHDFYRIRTGRRRVYRR